MSDTTPSPALSRPRFSFAIFNWSDRQDLSLDDIAAALNEQINRDLAQAWGFSGVVRVGVVFNDTPDRAPGEIAINIRAAIPEAPGALGYHQDTNGVPDIEIGLNVIEGTTRGPQCLAAVISHEVCETCGDPGANQWSDRGDGKMRAVELCDTVEDVTYLASNGVEISDFLLPSAFIPGAPAPWDQCQALASQNDLTPGGYDIECSSPTDVSDVTERNSPNALHRPPHASRVSLKSKAWHGPHDALTPFTGKRLAKKRSPYSRTRRRGVKL